MILIRPFKTNSIMVYKSPSVCLFVEFSSNYTESFLTIDWIHFCETHFSAFWKLPYSYCYDIFSHVTPQLDNPLLSKLQTLHSCLLEWYVPSFFFFFLETFRFKVIFSLFIYNFFFAYRTVTWERNSLFCNSNISYKVQKSP